MWFIIAGEWEGIHFSAIWTDVGKGVQHVSELVGREVLRVVVPAVDGL